MYATKLVIRGDVPSKKNNKQIFVNKRTGKPFISSSKSHKLWHKGAMLQLQSFRRQYARLDEMRVKFFPSTARKFDLSNKFESIADLLVDAKILEDDNNGVLGKILLEFGGVSRIDPRVEIDFIN